MASETDRIVLNVGGVRYETSIGTLRNIGSYFVNLCDPHSQFYRQPVDGAYFVDRDPEIFKYVLNFARSKHIPPEVDYCGLLAEAEFFSYEDLIDYLSTHKDDHMTKIQWIDCALNRMRLRKKSTNSVTRSTMRRRLPHFWVRWHRIKFCWHRIKFILH